MKDKIGSNHPNEGCDPANVPLPAALPGRHGLARMWAALGNSLRGIGHGTASEAAIKQEIAVVAVALPVSFFLATSVLQWIALVGCLVLMLAVEFLNTAIERLCDHVNPSRHDAIRNTKDLASAGVFFTQILAGLVWLAIAADRLRLFEEP